MLTIGHSVLPVERFLAALEAHGCRVLVDVRRYPGSRRNPQYSQAALFRSLASVGIEGVWRVGLGGHRTPQPDSINTGLRESFRGYADYMQTPEFAAEIDWLVTHTQQTELTVMCAEGDPSHCHRSFIADAVLTRGVPVEHILIGPDGSSSLQPHALRSTAQVRDGRIWYPARPGLFDLI